MNLNWIYEGGFLRSKKEDPCEDCIQHVRKSILELHETDQNMSKSSVHFGIAAMFMRNGIAHRKYLDLLEEIDFDYSLLLFHRSWESLKFSLDLYRYILSKPNGAEIISHRNGNVFITDVYDCKGKKELTNFIDLLISNKVNLNVISKNEENIETILTSIICSQYDNIELGNVEFTKHLLKKVLCQLDISEEYSIQSVMSLMDFQTICIYETHITIIDTIFIICLVTPNIVDVLIDVGIDINPKHVLNMILDEGEDENIVYVIKKILWKYPNIFDYFESKVTKDDFSYKYICRFKSLFQKEIQELKSVNECSNLLRLFL